MNTPHEGPSGPAAQASPVATPPPPPTAATEDWQQRYEQANRRNLYLSVAAAAAAVVAVVAVFWGVGQAASTSVNASANGMPGAGAQQFGDGSAGSMPGDGSTGSMPGSGSTGSMPGGGMQGGPGAGIDPATELFTDDGGVDTAALDEFLTMAPPGLDPLDMVDRMASDGAITSEQADQLRAAIAATGGSGGDSSSATTGQSNRNA